MGAFENELRSQKTQFLADVGIYDKSYRKNTNVTCMGCKYFRSFLMLLLGVVVVVVSVTVTNVILNSIFGQ